MNGVRSPISRVREMGSGLPFPKADAMWELGDRTPDVLHYNLGNYFAGSEKV